MGTVAASAAFKGALWLGADAVAYGYCLDPARPGLRCWVEIMAEDQLAATVLAREPNEDLAALGATDFRHGFRVPLPPRVLTRRGDILVWARVRGVRRGFAQRLLTRPEWDAGGPDHLAASVARLSAQLGQVVRPRRSGVAWREVAGSLARHLAREMGRMPPTPELPFRRHPSITLAFHAGRDPGAALRVVAGLAPLARARDAEVLAMTAPGALECLALPALAPNLRLAEAAPDLPRGAASAARGDTLLVLDPAGPALSPDSLDRVQEGRLVPGVLALAVRDAAGVFPPLSGWTT